MFDRFLKMASVVTLLYTALSPSSFAFTACRSFDEFSKRLDFATNMNTIINLSKEATEFRTTLMGLGVNELSHSKRLDEVCDTGILSLFTFNGIIKIAGKSDILKNEMSVAKAYTIGYKKFVERSTCKEEIQLINELDVSDDMYVAIGPVLSDLRLMVPALRALHNAAKENLQAALSSPIIKGLLTKLCN